MTIRQNPALKLCSDKHSNAGEKSWGIYSAGLTLYVHIKNPDSHFEWYITRQ